ncbi:hypothetical protein, partial [Winogradskyella sp. A2]|uniref:Ig-like domain-containing protein n=1 Tax=Winogradskyella sp. A2 TaxID=3366944 RepID=UPI00398C7C23
MKRATCLLAFLFFISISFSNVFAQGTENFENETAGSTTFTENGQGFTITNGPGETTYDIELVSGAGWNGSAPDNKFIDNSSGLPIQNDGTSFTISTSNGADISMTSVYLFISTRALANPTTTLTITGKKDGAVVYTITKTSGFSNVQTFTPNNGFTFINFASEGGVDNSTTKVDEIIFSTTNNADYIALDNFIYDFEVVEADPPEVLSIAVVGTPPTTATAVNFSVTFNEDAFNVTTTDFSLNTSGTTGTISGISGSGSAYTVAVSGISGEGTIRLDLLGGTDIEDAVGNSPPPAFSAGEVHTVSRCFQETYETISTGASTWSSNGVLFAMSPTTLNIENFANAGANDSDRFLSNATDLGTGKMYTISTPGPELFTVESLEVFLSSNGGTSPTNDGSIVFEGKLSGSTLYTITKNSGFPTTAAGIDNGFSVIDFATAGATDHSLTNIDELKITMGGAFNYIAFDNFEHCEEVTAAAPPIVQSINLVGNPVAVSTAVSFDVVFNEVALNVSSDDFILTTTGSAVGTIASLTGSGNAYTVNINTISGEGSLRLDLKGFTNIQDISGNTPPDPFTSGEVHIVSTCDVETFESLSDDTFAWTTNITPFTTGSANLSVVEFTGAGAGASDRFLDNVNDQGTGKVYSISITDTSFMFLGSMAFYVSSILDGTDPTNDGTLTVRGKLDGVQQFEVIKSSGFPTFIGPEKGFFTWDATTEGGTDYSLTVIDELEIELGGAFQYLAIDNFKFCDCPILDLPISGGDQVECNSGQTLTTTATVNTGETVDWYSEATDGVLVADPSLTGAGNITYYAETRNTATGCTSSARTAVSLTINALPTVTFTALADLPSDTGIQTSQGGGTPSGGVYSGTGVTDDGNGTTYSFDPALAGVGTYTITYAFTDSNGCTASAIDDVNVTLPQSPFITTWQTGASNVSITIPTNPGYVYDYSIDWGDGTVENNVTG